jgi:hypothetical protein
MEVRRCRSPLWGLLRSSRDEGPGWPRPVFGDCEQDAGLYFFRLWHRIFMFLEGYEKKNVLTRGLLITVLRLDQGTPWLSELVLQRISRGVPKQCGHPINENWWPILIPGYRKSPPFLVDEILIHHIFWLHNLMCSFYKYSTCSLPSGFREKVPISKPIL